MSQLSSYSFHTFSQCHQLTTATHFPTITRLGDLRSTRQSFYGQRKYAPQNNTAYSNSVFYRLHCRTQLKVGSRGLQCPNENATDRVILHLLEWQIFLAFQSKQLHEFNLFHAVEKLENARIEHPYGANSTKGNVFHSVQPYNWEISSHSNRCHVFTCLFPIVDCILIRGITASNSSTINGLVHC